jgi:putative transposase
MARLVVPGYPHHVTQRGNRKQATFFCDDDYLEYLALLRRHQARAQLEILAYCLMPNHVHLVTVPGRPDSIAKLLRVTHHRYALRINARNDWQGHLWQERFHSFVMDEPHLLAAVRYIELNPVRAGLCRRPDQWRWSSVHAHLHERPDPIVNVAPMCDRIADWASFLRAADSGPSNDALREHTSTGRPAGDAAFIAELEALSGRRLHRLKPGPPAKRELKPGPPAKS